MTTPLNRAVDTPVRACWLDESNPAGSLVAGMIAARAALAPASNALTDRTETVTYGELERRSNQLGRHLQTLGVTPGDPVAILMHRSAAFVVAALSVWKAGAVYVPLDHTTPADRMATILADAGVRVVITHRWMGASLAQGARQVLDLDVDLAAWSQQPAAPLETGTLPGDLAYIIYTSGSTGKPKGVEIEHRNLTNLVGWHTRTFGIGQASRVSQLSSLSFDAAVWEMWPTLAAGASLHFTPELTRKSAESLRDWLVAEQVDVAFAPTVLAEQLIELEWPSGTLLRTLLTGADTLQSHPRAGLPFTLVNNYGPTECTVLVTSGAVAPAGGGVGPRPSIGRAIANTRIHILDEHLAPVAPGQEGELCVSGAQVGRGYRNLPELTAARFVRPPWDRAERLYRTGDRARCPASGEIEFLGRIDDQMKVRGFRVEPEEIVTALRLVQGVRGAAVVGREGPAGTTLVAYVVAAASAGLTRSRLREALAQRLPDYMVPAIFVAVDHLPVNANGKCDKAALPEPSSATTIEDAAQSSVARSGLEEQISQAVAGLVSVREVGRDDNFFMIGGHSMLGAQLLMKLRQTFGIQLTLRQLFESPTVASLAGAVEQQLAKAAAAPKPFA